MLLKSAFFRTSSFDMVSRNAFNFSTISPTTACGLRTKKTKIKFFLVLGPISHLSSRECQQHQHPCDNCFPPSAETSPTGLKYFLCPMEMGIQFKRLNLFQNYRMLKLQHPFHSVVLYACHSKPAFIFIPGQSCLKSGMIKKNSL